MKNDAVAAEIESRADKILTELEDREVRPFAVTEVEVDNADVYHGDAPFTRGAKKAFLSLLRVKEDFPELGQSVDRARWAVAVKTIKDTRSDQSLFALYGTDAQGKKSVQAIYPKRPEYSDVTRHRNIVSAIAGSLRDSDVEFGLEKMSFDPGVDTFDITLLETDSMNVGAGDIWRAGSKFQFNEMEFRHFPHFLRLSCENGMTTTQYAYKSKIDQRKHSIIKIGEVIRRSLVDPNSALADLIRFAVSHLRVRNASVAEFQSMRGALKKALKEDEELFQSLDARYFDDAHIQRAYGVILGDQTPKWRASADSGVNAYDLFNLTTWVASHSKDTGIADPDQQLALQISAANFLFKNPLDMEDIAPQVDIPAHKTPEMA